MEGNPQIRLWNQDLPDYGGNPDWFTVEIEHNGFFCGVGANLTYVSGTLDNFDFCNADTWSVLWIEHILAELGYQMDGRLKVYWCLPGKDITYGLICVDNNGAIVQMINASANHKTLCLLVDHSNFLKNLRPEAILNGGPAFPPEGGDNDAAGHEEEGGDNGADDAQAAQGEGAEDAQAAHDGQAAHDAQAVDDGGAVTDAEAVIDEDGEGDTDSDFCDSDWDAEDGDDDMFDAQVDIEVNDHNQPLDVNDLEDDAATGDEDLKLTIEEEEYLKFKFREFNPEVDMDSPVFKAGMVFSDANELRHDLAAYSIRNRVKIRKVRNEAGRINDVCEPGCTWKLNASSDARKEALTIRKYTEKHTCEETFELKALSAPFLTRYFLNEFRDNQKMDMATFAAKIEREFNMEPNRWKLTRARNMALTIIHGDEAVQFNTLRDYGKELMRSNPGSKFFLSTTPSEATGDEEPKEHLSSLYWSYDACTRGFLKGCRPFICVDGCHIKTRYKGQLLTALGVDPNDCIYPIAMGLVEVECTSSWEWFLTTLKEDLNITNTSPFTIMSDKQKGLIKAVKKVFPGSEHRHCVRHLYQNFHKKHKGETLKNNLWAIAISTNIPTWERNMEKMKVDNEDAYKWVEELEPKTWIKAFF